ncbi:hypothetical protein PNOK_0131700 [Pyrrhoderma noxium]|uniref:Uncharacterized protein n=1 Tax=Pyrrhoderma noxium TaxID=2282107 RepID=A0A286UXC5_9AGAM|nr:hypothetical protein PNOK_0131700 [Pyrrhoderma noxium]
MDQSGLSCSTNIGTYNSVGRDQYNKTVTKEFRGPVINRPQFCLILNQDSDTERNGDKDAILFSKKEPDSVSRFLLSDIPFPVLASQLPPIEPSNDDDNEGDEASDNREWTLFEGRKSWSSLGGKRLITSSFPPRLYLSILCPLAPSLHSLSSSIYLPQPPSIPSSIWYTRIL